MTLYKWLTPKMFTCYQHVEWPVPIGEWTPSRHPARCRSGWHLATVDGLVDNLIRAPMALWEAEGGGACVKSLDKIAFERVRLVRKVGEVNKSIARLLACDFAEHALPIFEERHPTDDRPRRAIEGARRHPLVVTQEELGTTLHAVMTATDAPQSAACAALWVAEGAWMGCVAHGARNAVARAQTPLPTWSTPRPAWFAERKWQGARLLEVLQ